MRGVDDPTGAELPRAEDRLAGLSSAEAAARHRSDGPNELPAARQRSVARELVDQLTHFFAVLLWAAALLALVARMPELAIAISVVVVVNGVFAYLQEHRAERAAARLHDLLPRRVSVRRDGVAIVVDAAELVVGDVVLLAAGDRVSADLRLAEGRSLAVDTSTMTGESVPDRPAPGAAVLAGTFVVEGEGVAVVSAIGEQTALAGIARLTRAGSRPVTPLAREISYLVRLIALISVAVGVGFFAVSLLVGMPATDGFLLGVGVMVALVPEGLLPTVTLSLAVGAQKMASHHALVRRLEAVETLGSTTFVCTDKTGTLTRNEMTVVAVWAPAGELLIDGGEGYDPTGEVNLAGTAPAVAAALRRVVETAWWCSDGRVEEDGGGRWRAVGDPMEAAIDVAAGRMRLAAGPPIIERWPFDPSRRRMSVLRDGRLALKGAPDATFPLCTGTTGAFDAVERYAARGWRVLAVAERELSFGEIGAPGDADAVETGLRLAGLLAFEDPPRSSSASSIAACRRAGIKVAMITGDHPATARAIAAEVGLLLPGSPVVVGADLPATDDALGSQIDYDGVVVARVTPGDKLRIARALRGRGHVVAMTGDGVNDGPAMHEADIGVAMGRSGTDVARESADLVLLDDDFATIVRAIEQGRSTFGNIRRFLTYHLTDNVAELAPFVVWALSGGHFPLAIGVLQVLALDIGTDLLPALALGAEPPGPGLLDRSPVSGRLLDRTVVRRAFARFGPAEAAVELLAFVGSLLAAGWRPGDPAPTGAVLYTASGAAFAAVVLGQLVTALACRSAEHPVWRTGLRGNRLLLGAILVELGALAVFLLVPPVAGILGQQFPSLPGLLIAASAIAVILAVDALDKKRHPGALLGSP